MQLRQEECSYDGVVEMRCPFPACLVGSRLAMQVFVLSSFFLQISAWDGGARLMDFRNYFITNSCQFSAYISKANLGASVTREPRQVLRLLTIQGSTLVRVRQCQDR